MKNATVNRLKKEALWVKINDKSIMEICNLPIDKTIDFFYNINLTQNEILFQSRF